MSKIPGPNKTAPRDLFNAVMDGQIPVRPPVAAKIWMDLACRLTNTPFIDALNDPLVAMRVIVDACLETGMDAARLFTFPFRKVEMRDGVYIHVDERGRRIGTIDIAGGWATHCDNPADRDIARDDIMMSYSHFIAAEPAINTAADLQRMAVPPAAYLEAVGFGKAVDGLLREAGNQIALVGDCGSGTLAFHVAMRGMTQALMDFIDDPALLEASMERGVDLCLQRARFFLNHGVRILRYNDSVANMSVISPGHWRTFILPHLKRFCDEVHRMAANARVYCHICGNTLPIMEDLAVSGLDCIAPLDPRGGMTVAQVRERLGPTFPLMGGMDTLSFVNASPDDFMAEANRCLEAGAAGPYVLGSGCVVPRTARVEHLRAMRPIAEMWATRHRRPGPT